MIVAPDRHQRLAQVVLGHRAGRATRTCRGSRCATDSSCTSSTPITSAIASRVRSSWVGPRPPHTMTASASVERPAQQRAPIRPRLSPTFTWSSESMPLAASCSPIHDELVSTIWPSSSSVPIATTSHRIRASRHRRPGPSGHGRLRLRPPQVLPAADRAPARPRSTAAQSHSHVRVERGGRQDREADGQLLGDRLALGELARRHADALGADEGAVQADQRSRGRR